MKRAALAFPALILVGVAGLLGAGAFVLNYSATVLAFPLGAGIVVCALCAVEMASDLVRHAPSPAASAETPEPLAASSVASVFTLALLTYGLGFVYGPAAYLLAYLRASGCSWRLAAAIAAVSLLVTWGLFITLLRVPLPIDPLWLS